MYHIHYMEYVDKILLFSFWLILSVWPWLVYVLKLKLTKIHFNKRQNIRLIELIIQQVYVMQRFSVEN